MPQEQQPSSALTTTLTTRIAGMTYLYVSNVIVIRTPAPIVKSSSHDGTSPDPLKKSSGNEANNINNTDYFFFKEAQIIAHHLQKDASTSTSMTNDMADNNNSHSPMSVTSISSSSLSNISPSRDEAIASSISSGAVNHESNNKGHHHNSISRNYSISDRNIDGSNIIGPLCFSNNIIQRAFSTLPRKVFGCHLYIGSGNVVTDVFSDTDGKRRTSLSCSGNTTAPTSISGYFSSLI